MEHNEVINSLIDKIIQGQTSDAKDDFEAVISSKLQQALDNKKIEVAQSIYPSSEISSEEEIEDDEQENENPELETTSET